MTEDIAYLGLAIESDAILAATERNRKFSASADGAERSAKGLETTTALLTRAMGLLGAALSVTELIRMTSVWTDLNSRVRNSVDAHESATQVMNRIDEMARRTYSSLELTAESYLRNARALTDLGYQSKTSTAAASASTSAATTAASEPTRTMNFTFTGTGGISREQFREFVEAANDFGGDGLRFTFSQA